MNQLPEPLSAKDKNSFAYKTLSYRLPVIITKVIDLLYCRRKIRPADLPAEEIGQFEEEIKRLIGELARLKYELQTNKPIETIVSELSDTKLWNDYIENERKHNPEVVYFNVSWLFSECYFYRRMREVFVQSKYHKNFDQFSKIKQESFINCLNMASDLGKFEKNIQNVDSMIYFYIMTSLWGNKFDLSLSCGASNDAINFDLQKLESKILVNEYSDLCSYVKQISQKPNYRIDVVLDNAGYELWTDLCLIETLHSINVLPKENGKVYWYVKKMPWFVSDTMRPDIEWMFNFIEQSTDIDDGQLKQASQCFRENFSKGNWVIEEHDFWTLPHDFAQMSSVAPDLYGNFCQSDLVLFKGDLNYRKLVGDLKWDFRIPFKQSLREFRPTTAICTLRTVKADVMVGVKDEKTLETIKNLPSDWMETGEFAVINFLNNK